MHVILTFMLLFVHNSGNIAVFGVMITDIIDFHEHLSTDVPKNSSNGMWMLTPCSRLICIGKACVMYSTLLVVGNFPFDLEVNKVILCKSHSSISSPPTELLLH